MTISSNFSTICQFFAAFYQSLFDWHPAIGNEHAARGLVLAEAPRRHRHLLSSSEYSIAPIFPPISTEPFPGSTGRRMQ